VRTFVGRGASGKVVSLAFAPDGKVAVSGDNYGTVKLWDVTTGRDIRNLDQNTDR
jgi:WD40 repeat protein